MFFYAKDGGYFQKWKDFSERKPRRLTTSPLSPTTQQHHITYHHHHHYTNCKPPPTNCKPKKSKTPINTKIIVKNYKILVNFVEKVVNKNKKFIYIIYISVTNENATTSNGMDNVVVHVMRIEHFKRDGRDDQIWYYSCLRWGYTKSVPHRDNIIYINTVGYTILQTLGT